MADSSSLSWPTKKDAEWLAAKQEALDEGEGGIVCTPVCTPVDEATIDAAIASVTRALAATDDPGLAAELVGERRAMREELRAMRDASGGLVDLAGRRARER